MSDQGSAAADEDWWINLGGVIFISLEVAAIASILWWQPASPAISEGFIAVVVALFVAFLFSIAKGHGGRIISLVFMFIISSIASILIPFGYLYHLVGLSDSLRKCRVYPTIWDGIYFSIITLTTVGYGDVTPTLRSRSIAASEALTGYIVMGLLISILVIIAQRNR